MHPPADNNRLLKREAAEDFIGPEFVSTLEFSPNYLLIAKQGM
jgi:hypothetical protein